MIDRLEALEVWLFEGFLEIIELLLPLLPCSLLEDWVQFDANCSCMFGGDCSSIHYNAMALTISKNAYLSKKLLGF